jgi:hypothetical protein
MRGYIAEQDTLDYLLEELSVVTSQVIGDLPKIVLITDPPSHFNCARSCLPDRSLFHSLCHDYSVMETTRDLQSAAEHARPNKRRHLAAGERQRAVRA